jgi:hypothetical protein
MSIDLRELATRLLAPWILAGMTAREAERHLRERGMSRSQACKFVSVNKHRLKLK